MSSARAKFFFYLYSLDFLSGSKHFKAFNREKNVSLVGLLFTIILAVIIITYSTVELITYFRQINFSLISMEDNSGKVDATKYVGNETIVLIRFINSIYNDEGKIVEQEIPDLLKILRVEVKQYDYEYGKSDYDIKKFTMENCSKYLTDNDLKKYKLPKNYLRQSLCPPVDKGLKLRWNSNGTSILNFNVYLCDNESDSNCYTKEEIDEKYKLGELSSITFGFLQEYNIIDNTNHTYPLSTESYLTEKYIYLNGQYNCESSSKYINYVSNDGMIFTTTKYYSGFRFDDFTCNFYEKDPSDFDTALVSINYSMDMNYLLNYIRNYEKITTIIVDITGIARIVFFIGGYCISLLSENYFSYKLFDEIFSQKYQSKNKNEINKNKDIQIYNNVSPQISSMKNIKKNNIKSFNRAESSNKINCENIHLKRKTKKPKTKKEKIKKNFMLNTNIIMNEINNDNSNNIALNKDNSTIKKIDDEKYSMILSRYLGYDINHKKRFRFWNFICSQFNRRNNNMKIINSCAKMINNYLSLEQVINNGINIDILLTNCESQEFNSIDILNTIIDEDFKKTIKNIKEKKE